VRNTEQVGYTNTRDGVSTFATLGSYQAICLWSVYRSSGEQYTQNTDRIDSGEYRMNLNGASMDGREYSEMLATAVAELAVIGIEGASGSGKSSFARMLQANLPSVRIIDGFVHRKSSNNSFLKPKAALYVFDEILYFDQSELAYLLTVLLEEQCAIILLYQCESDLSESVRMLISQRFTLTRDGLSPTHSN
jgi:hypothetical protein